MHGDERGDDGRDRRVSGGAAAAAARAAGRGVAVLGDELLRDDGAQPRALRLAGQPQPPARLASGRRARESLCKQPRPLEHRLHPSGGGCAVALGLALGRRRGVAAARPAPVAAA